MDRCIREAESIMWKINKFVSMCMIVNWGVWLEEQTYGEIHIGDKLPNTN